MSSRPRPLDLVRVAVALALLIDRRAGKPCPTMSDIAGHTAVPHRRVWACVRALSENGIIEVEERGAHVQRQRRMRAFCGEWTDWTMRRPRKAGRAALRAAQGTSTCEEKGATGWRAPGK